ncbi:hypothetical protein [Nocardia crassostreae]|uniref:hypothetical protein n=1 Tax=Nocardia crassostreae TaxID=53428 RepID=UPI000832EFE6|nr:hypothetical protein [Nocardia crassostreae]
MVRLLYSVGPAVAAVGALATVFVVPPLLDAAVPTRETEVTPGTVITLAASGVGSLSGGDDPANAVAFLVPEPMDRIATGDESIAVLRSRQDDQRLAVTVADGITDFEVAAPRLLLPLKAAGEQVYFDGGAFRAGEFEGLTCVLPNTAGGVCAVAKSGDVAVTVTVAGTTREAGRALIAMVLESSKAVTE